MARGGIEPPTRGFSVPIRPYTTNQHGPYRATIPEVRVVARCPSSPPFTPGSGTIRAQTIPPFVGPFNHPADVGGVKSRGPRSGSPPQYCDWLPQLIVLAQAGPGQQIRKSHFSIEPLPWAIFRARSAEEFDRGGAVVLEIPGQGCGGHAAIRLFLRTRATPAPAASASLPQSLALTQPLAPLLANYANRDHIRRDTPASANSARVVHRPWKEHSASASPSRSGSCS